MNIDLDSLQNYVIFFDVTITSALYWIKLSQIITSSNVIVHFYEH